MDFDALSLEFEMLLEKHTHISMISHIHPDADAIGTSLGIGEWLRGRGKKVEVVNATVDIPKNLDFLPLFSKIKNKIDYGNSLVIACDCGSIDRLGFDLGGRTIVNIDHHLTNTMYGSLNIVNPDAVSSSQVAFDVLDTIHPVSSSAATSFYAALISDTLNFTTSNMSGETFVFAQKLAKLGVDIPKVASMMLRRRSLASLRILGIAIDSLELLENAQVAVMTITRDDRKSSGASGSDMDSIVDYAISLATVRVAVMIVERKNEIKISLRSYGADVSRIARVFGGGGHKASAGFELSDSTITQSKLEVLSAIKEKEILHETL